MRFRRKFDEEAQMRACVNARVQNREPSMTDQSSAVDCDLNVIMKRFGATNSPVPYIPTDPRYYGEFSDEFTLQNALDVVRDAQEKFFALPAELRAEFDNNPVLMHEWVMDPANKDEAIAMGLLRDVSRPQGAVSQPPPSPSTPPAPSTPPPAS